MATELVELQALREVAESAAVRAGDVAREKFSQPRRLTSKGFRDIVTDADLAAQQIITDMIRRRFPDHGFLTEELDEQLPSNGVITWIIDPIDGTTNYSRQIPVFCVSIGAVTKQSAGQCRVLTGVVYDPMRGELFSAAAGLGSLLNGRPVKTSNVSEMGSAIIGLDWSRDREMRQDALDAVDRFAHGVHNVRSMGSAALALAWIAAGRLDGYMNFSLYDWDVAAAELMIREAGGVLSDMSGRHWGFSGSQGSCIASNGLIHQKFLEIVTGNGDR